MKNSTPNKYNMIVAADLNWCIGNNGHLLAHIAEDMTFFKQTTANKVVIMGKNTQVSLPNKTYLENRFNIVLDKDSPTNPNNFRDVVTNGKNTNPVLYISDVDTLDSQLKVLRVLRKISIGLPRYSFNPNDIFVIGGGQIYKYFLEHDLIDTVYLTTIYHEYEGDTHIPNLYDLGFKETSVIVPKTTNEKGITYGISILKK